MPIFALNLSMPFIPQFFEAQASAVGLPVDSSIPTIASVLVACTS